jgi:hypothetical protein
MNRVAAVLALVLAAAAPAQDDSQLLHLLRRLDDDSIDVRAAAAADLAKYGKSAVPLLRRSAANAGPEMRDRLAEIVRKIQDRERLAALLPPPSCVTLEAVDRPLAEVLQTLERQSRTPLDLTKVPSDARVTLSLRGTAYWKALEEICRASGRVMASPEGNRIVVSPEPYTAVPQFATTHFRVSLQRIDLTSNGTLGQPDRFDHFLAALDVCWEKGAQPWRIAAKLLELVDEKGDEISISESESICTSIAPDAIHQEIPLDEPHGPGPQATRISRMRVEVTLDFPLRFAELRLPIAPGKPTPAVECPEFAVRLDRLDRQEGGLMAALTVTLGAAPPEGDLQSEGVSLVDLKGNTYSGQIRGDPQAPDAGSRMEVLFADAPPVAQLKELLVRIPAEVHRERLDVDLKDIPLR